MPENCNRNEPRNATRISSDDMRVLTAIKQITRRGENAEVRQTKNGGLSVYAVKKSKQI